MKKNRAWIKFTISICIAVLFYHILNNLSSISSLIDTFFKLLRPLMIGIVIAYILSPAIEFIEKKVLNKIKSRPLAHHLAITGTYTIFIALVFIPLIFMVNNTLSYVENLINSIEQYRIELEKFLDELSENAIYSHLNIDKEVILGFIDNTINNASKYILNNYNSILQTSMNFGKAATNLGIGFVLSIYFSTDKDKILDWIGTLIKLVLKEESYNKAKNFWLRCHKILSKYIQLNLADAFIVGTVNLIFMLLFKIPNEIIITVAVAVTNLAPTFGPIVGAIIGGLLLLLSSPQHLILWLVFTLVLQTIDGYYIKPKLFGGEFGLPPIILLTFIIVFGRIFGAIGVVLSVPLAAIASFMYNEIIAVKLREVKLKKTNKSEEGVDDGKGRG